MIFPRLITFLVVCLLSGALHAGYEFAWEGFEREINWDAQTGSAATGRVVNDTIFSEGGHSLKLLFNSVAKAGRAVYSRFLTADWSPYGALIFDVYNPTDLSNIQVAVLILSTDRYLAHEYLLPPLHKGWNRSLRVDLKAKKFSSTASDYQPAAYLVGRGEIKAMQFLIYPGTAAEGALYLDNLRLERAGLLAVGPLTLNTTLDLVSSVGDLDYLPPDMRIRRGDLTPLESFEGGTAWGTADADIAIEPTSDFLSHGGSALSVSFPSVPDGFDLDMTGMETRLAGTRQLRMDIYNVGPGVSVALWLEDAAGKTYQSSHRLLRHGWNTRVFDFTNQNVWNGAVIDESVLSNLKDVSLNIVSQFPGRLIFDGLESGSLTLRGAAKAGTLLSLSYNPLPNLEFIGDYRLEDTFYGDRLSNIRSASPEAYLDAGSLRLDLGEFRSGFLYRRRINPLDQPIFLLVSPHNLGREIAGFEAAGRVLNTEIQGLVASRLKYDRYNSRRPTGFGPESVATLRFRRNLTETTRLGATHLTHLSKYGSGVSGVPAQRQTWGLDVESHLSGKGSALNIAVEGGMTTGDRPLLAEGAPERDRFYFGTNLSPEWGRLNLAGWYTLFGYEFDAAFTTLGGNWAGYGLNGGLNLEDWFVFRHLKTLPLYDRSIGNNLSLNWEYTTWATRDRYTDAITGELRPRYEQESFEVALGNDYKARPNFRLSAEYENTDNQWYRTPSVIESVYLRLPLPWDLVTSWSGTFNQGRTIDRSTGEQGNNWAETYHISLERYFKFNLFLNGRGRWIRSRRSWEGAWEDIDSHFKLTWGARQAIGANTVIELNYGFPALFGRDFGLQDTIDVYTLTVKSYF